MEKMSEKERKRLNELQAKYKRVIRADELFFRNADERREELLARWQLSDRLQEAANIIGTDVDTLFDWITRHDQIEFFHKHHQ